MCQRSVTAALWFSGWTLKWPSLAETRKSIGSSGRGTGDEVDGERLELPSLESSGRGTGDEMDGERPELPGLERLARGTGDERDGERLEVPGL